MLVRQFPDLNVVRGLKNDATQPDKAWRNIALNIRCKEVSRLGIESPYSLFMNVRGHSWCTVNKQQYRIEDDTVLLTQPGDVYGLEIDNIATTEIFNIHLNREFVEANSSALLTGSAALLDGATGVNTTMVLATQTMSKTDGINSIVARLQMAGEADTEDTYEVIFAELVTQLVMAEAANQRKVAALPVLRGAVKQDLYRRLLRACDYIHSYYYKAIDLDELCGIAAMSKFHFLRVFRAFYGVTPYQYLTRVRIEKACRLLRCTRDGVGEISASLGYEYPNSFIKAFNKTMGMAPLQYRRM